MRKLIAILLALVFVVSLSSCVLVKPSDTNRPEPSQISDKADKDTVAPVESESESEKEPDTKDTEKSTTVPSDRTYTIKDEVIVDDENATFTITEMEEDNFWGVAAKVYCENKTADKTLRFQIGDASINGYAVSILMYEDVAPGKKSNESFTIYSSDLDKIGIQTVDELVFELKISDADDYSADDLVNDTFTVYPTGLSANEIEYPERRTTSTEQVIVDNNDFCVIILGEKEDDIWGYDLDCYVENKTDKTLMIKMEDVSVNGFMVDPYWYVQIAPGLKKYSDITFSSSDFEENGITDVEEIEFILRAYDYGNWLSDDIFNDTFTYSPQ